MIAPVEIVKSGGAVAVNVAYLSSRLNQISNCLNQISNCELKQLVRQKLSKKVIARNFCQHFGQSVGSPSSDLKRARLDK